MRYLFVALAVALIASGEASAQVTSQPSGLGGNFCAPQTLTFGAIPDASSISATGEVGCYRFDGVAGDRVRIRVLATSGNLDPAVTVAPNGVSPCVAMTADDATCTLTTTGRHSITVADRDGTKTGQYAISIQRLNDPVGCGAALSYGTTGTLETLTSLGDSECHRFTAGAGDRVRVQTQSTVYDTAPGAELVRPDGRSLCGISSGPLTCTVTEAGQYTVMVRDPLPGGYGVSIQRLNNPVGCTSVFAGNGPLTGSLSTAGMTRCYRFDGDAGNRLRVRVVATGGALEPTTEVVRPDGTTLCSRSPADNVTCLLDADGNHTIVVADAGVPPSGQFKIEVQRLDAPTGCATRSFGTLAASAALEAAGSDCHRFTATAGDQVRVHVRTTSAVQPYVEILNPDGTARCTSAEIICPIQQTGAHTILVTDSSPGTRSGGYQVSVQRTSNPVGCTMTTFGTGSFHGELGIGQTYCVRFEGTAGDRIRLRAVNANPMNLVADVINPDGTRRCGTTAAGNVTCLLSATGTHTLLIRDSPGDLFGHFWANLQRLNNPVGCTTLTSAAPPVVSGIGMVETECWRYPGVAGERVQLKLHRTWGDLEPHIEWLRPDGRTLAIQTGGADSFKDIHETGTHTILVRDTGLDTGQYEIQWFD